MKMCGNSEGKFSYVGHLKRDHSSVVLFLRSVFVIPIPPPSLSTTYGLSPLLVFRIPEVAEKRRKRRAVTRRRAAVMRRARLLLFLLATTLLFFRHFRRAARRPPPVAVACTVHVGAPTLLELDDFLKYHSAIHVGRFYLFVEGDSRHRGHASLRSLARRYNALVVHAAET